MREDLAKLRHARSHKDYPGIDLEEDEYVEMCIRRSPLVPVVVWSGVVLLAFVFLALNILMSATTGNFAISGSSRAFMSLVSLVVMGAVVVIALVYVHVYKNNFLYVTNKRIIQSSMISLFSNSMNIIDLVSIEDVSFRQNGVWEKLFKIGTLRMSTVGDETTYTFNFVDTPHDELETITHLVHIQKEDKSDSAKVEKDVKKIRESVDDVKEALDVAAPDLPVTNDAPADGPVVVPPSME